MGVDLPLEGPARWTLRTRLLLLFAAVLVLITATLVVQIVQLRHQQDVRDELLRNIDPAVQAATDVRAATAEQESAIRGYAFTGDAGFLDEYVDGDRAAAAGLNELDELLGPTHAFDADVDRVRSLLERWQTTSAQPVIDASSAADRDALTSEAFQEASLENVNALWTALDEIDTQLATEREAQVDELDDAARSATLAMVLQVAGVIVSGVIVLAGLTRVVTGPIGRLGDDARKVAAGDLDHPVRGVGSPDLVRLGGDVDAMRSRIVAEVNRLNAASADLERQAQELARSNRDLEQFAYVASHDLQEPLRKVSSFCQLLQKRYSDQLDERANEYIDYAVDGAKRMQDLINDLLAFSRVGRTTEAFEPVDLGAVVDDVIDALAPAIEDADAAVTVGELPVVSGDRRLLGATMQNLISNALKFRREEPPKVDITATLCAGADGDEWVISVTDNGIGIDPDYDEQIFVIFKRLHSKAEYSGTGIGLALAKKIAEFHGGRIWLEPTPPPGATFKLALPAPPSTEKRVRTDAG